MARINLKPSEGPTPESKSAMAVVGRDYQIIELIESCGYDYVGYFDRDDVGLGRLGVDTDSGDDLYNRVFGMHMPAAREKLWDYHAQHIVTLVHPQAHISETVNIGQGVTVQMNCTLLAHAEIGHGCQINFGATVHHQSRVEPFVTLAPHSVVLGRVRIGTGAYIGAGAIIREDCCIGARAMVGAGAVVVSDIPAGATVVGVPAKPLSK
jgi:sugar O-acyltransferase (sialic acid O-acetyltransferase NeuD family)